MKEKAEFGRSHAEAQRRGGKKGDLAIRCGERKGHKKEGVEFFRIHRAAMIGGRNSRDAVWGKGNRKSEDGSVSRELDPPRWIGNRGRDGLVGGTPVTPIWALAT